MASTDTLWFAFLSEEKSAVRLRSRADLEAAMARQSAMETEAEAAAARLAALETDKAGLTSELAASEAWRKEGCSASDEDARPR